MTDSSKHEVELREIMTTDLFTVDPGTTLEEVASLLTAEHIGGVPVVERHTELQRFEEEA